jgi:hypothetical protein
MSIQLLGNCLSTDRGAFTQVYVYPSQHIGDAKKYVVRLFNNERGQQEGLLATFVADCERLLALNLNHINIVQHVRMFSDTNRYGLIMEMMEISLTSHLHGSANIIPFHIQIGLSHDIAQGLAYLHQNGIIHQNLTAKSVFLMQDSHTNLPLAKVGDFGMTNFLYSTGLRTQAPSIQFDIKCFGALVAEIMSQQYVHVSAIQQIDSIIRDRDNPLVSIVKCCFEDDSIRADILAMRIAKQTIAYTCRQLEQKVTLQQTLKSTDADLQRSCDAVMDHTRNIIYLRQGKKKKLFVFNLNHNAWETRPDCKLLQCALVFYEGNLLAIGGTETDNSQRSNAVYKLVEDVQDWELQTELLTARSRTTALECTFNNENILIVAGGERLVPSSDPDSRFESMRTVEVGTGQQWCLASDLPGTLCCASGTVINENVCLLGGWSKRGEELLDVYTCRLSELIETVNSPSTQVWSRLKITPCPVGSTTGISLQGKLLIVGGNNPRGDSAIRVYNEHSKTWDVIGRLPESRYLCYAQALCNCRFLITGGCNSSTVATGDAYIYELK